MILILGGTSEASALARLLAGRPDIPALLSLAGRTAAPALPPIPHRIGGFGGAEGLARFLCEKAVTAVVDATHPFAARISANAAAACAAAGVPLLVLRRSPWRAQPGDRWTLVPDAPAAVQALGETPRRVFLTVGRLELPAFLAAPQHRYLVRTIDTPDRLPPDSRLLLARPPFDMASEAALMRRETIEVVVTKNSGGEATYGKIAAARSLGLPVILLEPPPVPEGAIAEPAAALAWIEAQSGGHHASHRRGE